MNDDSSSPRGSLLNGSSLVALSLLIAAWASNPDEAHFRRTVARSVQSQLRQGGAEAALTLLKPANLASFDWERTNFGLWSMLTIYEHGATKSRLVGCYGMWIPVPEVTWGGSQ